MFRHVISIDIKFDVHTLKNIVTDDEAILISEVAFDQKSFELWQ